MSSFIQFIFSDPQAFCAMSVQCRRVSQWLRLINYSLIQNNYLLLVWWGFIMTTILPICWLSFQFLFAGLDFLWYRNVGDPRLQISSWNLLSTGIGRKQNVSASNSCAETDPSNVNMYVLKNAVMDVWLSWSWRCCKKVNVVKFHKCIN